VLTWPNGIHKPNGKSIFLALFAQLTAKFLYTLQWGPLSSKIAPFPWSDLDRHLIRDSFGQSVLITQTVSTSVEPYFGQMTAD